MQLVELAISSAVLEGRNEDGFGFQGDDALDVGSHAGTAIHDGILGRSISGRSLLRRSFSSSIPCRSSPLPDIRNIDVIEVADATDSLLASQFVHQLAMGSDENSTPLHRRPHGIGSTSHARSALQGESGNRLIPLLSFRNQDVAMQQRSRLPRVGNDSLSILIINAFCSIGSLFPIAMLHDGEQLGVLHLQGISSLSISSSRLSSLACRHQQGHRCPTQKNIQFLHNLTKYVCKDTKKSPFSVCFLEYSLYFCPQI